jgi:4-amino-4-deoxy-L-arabinose transferase-like glycosyltransferase
MAFILLAAAILRIYGLNNLSPPGLEHDEVAHWLINRDILAGQHAIYFTEAFGHEAGFHYIQSSFQVLLGDNVLALRLPSAFAGLLLVAVSFALARRLFDLRTALLSASLMAILFWPIFYSRLALRAIALPLLSGLSAYFWWRGWQYGLKEGESIQRNGDLLPSRLRLDSPYLSFILAGLFAALSLYIYMAGRVVPLFYLLFTIYLLLFHHPALRRRWRGVLLFFLVFLILASPLIIFLLTNPGAEARISEVNGPLLGLLAGDLGPVVENSLKFLAMFGLRGDPLWRQNVAYLPVFDPLIALLFYIGLLISLWRWHKPNYLFVMLWLFTAAIPSIVTIDAPSSIRIINALPVLAILPVIGLEVIHIFSPLSTVTARLSPNIGRILALIGLLLLLVLNIGRTTQAVFQTWPANDEVQFVWQQALTEAAIYLDASSEDNAVAIGGWTPETMDPPTMELSLRREDLSLRYFDPTQSLIIPGGSADQGGADQPSRIIRPAILPLDPILEAQLTAWGALPEEIESFTLYWVPGNLPIVPRVSTGVTFDNELTFLGYEPLASGEVLTYWRVVAPTGEPRSLFLHEVDEDGQILAQGDGLGTPAAFWQSGDILLQKLTLDTPSEGGGFKWRLGVYNPETGQRLITGEGADFVLLSPE